MQHEEVRLLAITRMEKGLCLAGVSARTGRWIRPVPRAGELQPDDLLDPSGRRAGLLDSVRITLLEPRPAPPHSEDWLVYPRPGWLRVTQPSSSVDRLAVLSRPAEGSADAVLRCDERSLCLVGPVEVVALHLDPANEYGRYDARVTFRLAGQEQHPSRRAPGMACTDVRFRALGRRLMLGGRPTTVPWEQAARDLRVEQVFLAIGLARPREGRCTPMVIGFHTMPDYSVEVDYGEL